MTQVSLLKIVPATMADYPTVQNMARFYVYDISRECGFISEEWACPQDGLYECFDFKSYFEDLSSRAFLVKMGEELAGFVLLDKAGTAPNLDWNMGQFFILAKFQGQGMGRQVAHEIWHTHPGRWEIAVIPENKRALTFWRRIIADFTNATYREELKDIDFDVHQPKRYILSFDSHKSRLSSPLPKTVGPLSVLPTSYYSQKINEDGYDVYVMGDDPEDRKWGIAILDITNAPQHVHKVGREHFVVLEGALDVTLDGVQHILKAGQFVHIPPGVVHHLKSASLTPVRVLCLNFPAFDIADRYVVG